MDATQIKIMEQQMLEEHRRDIEALERLKRFLPSNGHVASTGDRRMTLPTVPLVIDSIDSDEDDGPSTTTTIRGTIEQIMAADLTKKWTVQKMLAHLLSINYQFKAQKPINSVSLSLQALYKKNRIILVKRGAGSEPNVYRGKQQPTEEAS